MIHKHNFHECYMNVTFTIGLLKGVTILLHELVKSISWYFDLQPVWILFDEAEVYTSQQN